MLDLLLCDEACQSLGILRLDPAREIARGGVETDWSPYSSCNRRGQHVELQRADDADDGLRAIDGPKSCTTPSSAISRRRP